MITLDLLQAAEFLHLHPHTLQARAKAGIVPGSKPGRCWVFRESALIDYLHAIPLPKGRTNIFIPKVPLKSKYGDLLTPEKIRTNKTLFPYSGPAVYFLFMDDDLVYIGKTVNLFSRLSSHFGKNKGFDNFSYIVCEREELITLERSAILKFRPKLNRV